MTQNFAPKDVTLFSRAVTALQPGAGGRSIVKLLDGKAKRAAVLNWRAGRRQAPQWAMGLLSSKLQARADSLAAIATAAVQAKERPGKQAGALNLAKWRARKIEP